MHPPRWPARPRLRAGATALLILIAATAGAGAQTWREIKCTRYQASWAEALKRRGTSGLSPTFLASHEAFIGSGCTDQGHVCPRSPAELDLANLMTIKSMNAGTASTFLPFACPR